MHQMVVQPVLDQRWLQSASGGLADRVARELPARCGRPGNSAQPGKLNYVKLLDRANPAVLVQLERAPTSQYVI